MKKTKSSKKSPKQLVEKPVDNLEKSEKAESVDDEDQGFGGWLRSEDGLETMKLFVIANSIVLGTTLVYPHIHTVLDIVYDMIYGEDSFY